jgi:acetyl-CoA carboxylase biotin carboxylase subunit
MKASLSETMLLGVDTLIPLHQAILKNQDFLSGDITIRFLEEHPGLLNGE